MKLYLQDIKVIAKFLQLKNCKIIFLQDLIKMLQENYLTILSCKSLARIFISLQEKLHFVVQGLQDMSNI